MTEGRRLQRIGRTAKDPVRLRRTIAVLMSAQGQSVPDIAHLLACSSGSVRGVIHAFNESGFAALDPNGEGAGPRRSVSRFGGRSACSPGAAPVTWAWHFSTWSLTKLAEYLVAAGIAGISRESVRQILHDAGINWLATKTWKVYRFRTRRSHCDLQFGRKRGLRQDRGSWLSACST